MVICSHHVSTLTVVQTCPYACGNILPQATLYIGIHTYKYKNQLQMVANWVQTLASYSATAVVSRNTRPGPRNGAP